MVTSANRSLGAVQNSNCRNVLGHQPLKKIQKTQAQINGHYTCRTWFLMTTVTYLGSLCPLQDRCSFKMHYRWPSFRALPLHHFHETIIVPWSWVIIISSNYPILQAHFILHVSTNKFTCSSDVQSRSCPVSTNAENFNLLMWNHCYEKQFPPQTNLLLYLHTIIFSDT